MRSFIVAVLCVSSLSLSGCGVFGPIQEMPGAEAKTELPEIGKQAQLVLNEANGTLAASAVVIRLNMKDKIWTKSQSQYYIDKVRIYRKQTSEAQDMIDLGNYVAGQSQAHTVRTLIALLHREVAAQARKEGAK